MTSQPTLERRQGIALALSMTATSRRRYLYTTPISQALSFDVQVEDVHQILGSRVDSIERT